MSSHGTALITGASGGIGLELAKIMAADGWDLVLIARREDILTDLGEELNDKFNVQTTVFAADLNDRNAAQQIFDTINKLEITVDCLVNNAGFGYYGSFKDQDIEKIISLIEVNISSLVRLTHLFGVEMVKRGSGRIMNVSSVVGYFPVPCFSIYSASKAFVLSFSRSLSKELAGSGVTVTCLSPGSTKTGFANAAGAKHMDKGFSNQMDATTVARIGYEGMMKGKSAVVAGLMNRIMRLIIRFLPTGMVISLVGKVMKKRDF
ncbi:MAG: SDR family oxidoreductase [Calditrichaeota bacterium]|nr:SDR family oxidoreductase [Calditrichota bacterium]